MPTVRPEPPQMFNWFALPFDQYERAQRAQAAFSRRWWAEFHRAEAFSRAQRGGN